MKRILTRYSVVWLLALHGPAWASNDSASDNPDGFADVIASSPGVIVRVPINDHGDENTDGAELRFYKGQASVNKASNPSDLWRGTVDLGRSPEVLGTNAPANRDSSTWGWYYWYNNGWSYPFYYSYYYPTFYYNNYYYYYNYYWNWNWYGYRYYYYYNYYYY